MAASFVTQGEAKLVGAPSMQMQREKSAVAACVWLAISTAAPITWPPQTDTVATREQPQQLPYSATGGNMRTGL